MSGPRSLPSISDEKMDAIRVMWANGATRAEVVAFAGVTAGRLFDRGIETRGKGVFCHPSLKDNPLPSRQGLGGGRRSGEDFIPRDPTGPEIAQACEQIRETWDEITTQERKYEGAPDLALHKHLGSASAHFHRMHRSDMSDRANPR